MSKTGSGESKNTLYCSFCGKSQHEVRKLIAGPSCFICDECIELCTMIIVDEGVVPGYSTYLIGVTQTHIDKMNAEGVTARTFLEGAFGGTVPAEATVSMLFHAIATNIAVRFGTTPERSRKFGEIDQKMAAAELRRNAAEEEIKRLQAERDAVSDNEPALVMLPVTKAAG